MKIIIFLMTVLLLGFLSGCAQMSPTGIAQSNGLHNAEQHVIDPNNHKEVAKHYEDVAREMRAKLRTQKKLLSDYEGHSYYYGRRGQDFQSHTRANIRHYEKSVEENLKEAAIHRKMAQDLERQNFGLIKEQKTTSQLN